MVLLSPACAGVFSSFRATRVSFIDFGLAMTRSGPLNFISVVVNNFPNLLKVGKFRYSIRVLREQCVAAYPTRKVLLVVK